MEIAQFIERLERALATDWDLTPIGPAQDEVAAFRDLSGHLFEDGRPVQIYGDRRVRWLNWKGIDQFIARNIGIPDDLCFLDVLVPFGEPQHRVAAELVRYLEWTSDAIVSYESIEYLPYKTKLYKDFDPRNYQHKDIEARSAILLMKDINLRFDLAFTQCFAEMRVVGRFSSPEGDRLLWPDQIARHQHRKRTSFLPIATILGNSAFEVTDHLRRDKPGPKPGVPRYPSDAAVVETALDLLRKGEASNPHQATDRAVSDPSELEGGGTAESKFKRIYREVKERWTLEKDRSPPTNSNKRK